MAGSMTGDIDVIHSALILLTVAVVTLILRSAPFVAFKKHTPRAVLYLGDVLPYAIMGMLVVYCLKGVTPLSGNHGLPELIAVSAVVIVHRLKHNTLLSILGGTVLYMILLQTVFA